MRGCQKKVIFLKNTGSYLFDEAYFIISKEGEKTTLSEESMILEENRIIENSYSEEPIEEPKRRRILSFMIPFTIGAFISSLIFIFCMYISFFYLI